MDLDFNSAAFYFLMLAFACLSLLTPNTKGEGWKWARIVTGILCGVLAVVLIARNVSVG